MRRLCATVLIFEAVVIGLAIPVAITIDHEPHTAAGVAGGVLAGVAPAAASARAHIRAQSVRSSRV